jgi:hypothetical protein
MIAAAPPIINVELATGRVRPLADKDCSIHLYRGAIFFLESGVVDDHAITDEKAAFPFVCLVRPGSARAELAQVSRL